MKKVVLYIAMSLDGYIADSEGGVAWLKGDDSEKDNPSSYGSFIETIDTVIMGYKTYNQIVTELSPDNWVYNDKTSYIITNKKIKNKHNILFTNKLQELLIELKKGRGKDIWICGGSNIVNQLLDLDLIDKIWVTIIPTLLGNGIPLFNKKENEVALKLVNTKTYNGCVDLIYEKR